MNTDHIVLDPDAPASSTEMVMLCRHCGSRCSIKLPIAAAMIGEAMITFVGKHASCKATKFDLIDAFRQLERRVRELEQRDAIREASRIRVHADDRRHG